ncbi:MAG: hypothetical protein RR896_04285 [Citrobacter sp.]
MKRTKHERRLSACLTAAQSTAICSALIAAAITLAKYQAAIS